jgi:BirA family biotin operon repressor/biotin-[acetyl-CoA-carboxylase] ligase
MTGDFTPIDWQSAKKFFPPDKRAGYVINSAPEMPSTQIPAKLAAREGAPHGTVFVTDFQSAGRGRRDRLWSARPGMDLTFSAIWRPALEAEFAPLLNLAAALSVCVVLEKIFTGGRLKIGVKWPNDVLADGKKICGIICECACAGNLLDYAVIGIGLNVNARREDMPEPDSPDRPHAASILSELGRETPLPRLLADSLISLDIYSSMVLSDRKRLMDLYRENCVTLGRNVKITSDDEEFLGAAEDVTDDGALAARGADGVLKFFRAADVVHARMEQLRP